MEICKDNENTTTRAEKKLYYEEWYPFDLIENLLTVNPEKGLYGREFGLPVLDAKTDKLKFVRNCSYRDCDAWKRAVRDSVPERIEAGSIHSSLNISSENEETRELRLDIDLDAYDDQRKCGCAGASACKKCWGFVVVAARLLSMAVTHSLGNANIIWVFSGRRGLHGWIRGNADRADLCVPVSDQDSRNALLSILNIFGTIKKSGSVDVLEIILETKPWVLRCIKDIIVPAFINDLDKSHNLLANAGIMQGALSMLPENGNYNKLFPSAGQETDARQIWSLLDEKKIITNTAKNYTISVAEWVALVTLAPRLDEPVAIEKRHMMKLPFCVHNATGAICLPLPPEILYNFDPQNDIVVLKSLFTDCTKKQIFDQSISYLEKILDGFPVS